MLSYEDCIALSGLTTEEIAAIAMHEHLPAMAALQMGVSLCDSGHGKLLIQRMIMEDSQKACRRGNLKAAARFGLVLHHFIEKHSERQALSLSAREERPVRLLDNSPREHVDSYLGAMLAHFGMEIEAVQDCFGPEMQIANMCCEACTESKRCRRFLTGMAEAETTPSSFCPNAPLLDALRHRLRSQQESGHSA